MGTIDGNGHLHDSLGRYANQDAPAANYDLAALGGDLDPPLTEGDSELKKEDLYRLGAIAGIGAVALTGITSCARSNDSTPPDPGPSVTAPTQTTPPPVQETPAAEEDGQGEVVDVKELATGDAVPAGQVGEARDAGVPVFQLRDGTGVVFDNESRLPQTILDDIAQENGTSAMTWANNIVEQFGGRDGATHPGVVLTRLRGHDMAGGTADFYMFQTTTRVGNFPGWTPDHNPASAQEEGFATHAEAMAFIQSWQNEHWELYDLTQ